MPFFTNTRNKIENTIYYEDYGAGQPVILIHGWPLSQKAWEQQVWKLVESGYRCISYDRRGFGLSDAPWDGYDYSTLASDLDALIQNLDLRDCILAGFSMGGGEVVRYCTDFGTERIDRVMLISSIIPLVKQKEDNPHGVPEKDLDAIKNALQSDRVGFLKEFHKGFYNADQNPEKVSEAQLEYDFIIASHASPRATIQTALSWMHTDFRDELKNVNVPTLIIHGDADQTVPLETSAKQADKGIENSRLVRIPGAPHGLNITHPKVLNTHMLEFMNADLQEPVAS